jgi:tRNA modification GTPase
MRQKFGPYRLSKCLHRYSPTLTRFGSFHARSELRKEVNKAPAIQPQRSLRGKHRGFAVAATNEPTIYALSTAAGRAAIAIIRISGPACLTVYEALCPGKLPPKPRCATLRTLYEPLRIGTDAQILDSGALVLYFPAPQTATGEDVLEFHVHGGTAVVKAMLAAIPKANLEGDSHNIRYADPGEFTRRAFYNNRLDLLQIEALGDTLSADTEQQRLLAVRGSTGILTNRYESWRQKLLLARGELEALIDFSEDQQFDESPAELCASVAHQVQELKSQLQANIESAARGELLRNGINIALIGAPNAGKSSLLNQIVGREAAIVSSEAGTTRDVVDVNVDISGFFCKFGDLAGLRKQPGSPHSQPIGEIEREGIRRAKDRALASDVVIVVLPACISERPEYTIEVEAEVVEILSQCDTDKQKIVCVLNKADLFPNSKLLSRVCQQHQQHKILSKYMDLSETILYAVSCKNAQYITPGNPDPGGIQVFLDGLTRLFERMTTAVVPRYRQGTIDNSAWAESLGASERQRSLLAQCLDHLESFSVQVGPTKKDEGESYFEEENIDIVLAAESLRSAAGCLSKITGKGDAGDVEEVLGVVFEKYRGT